MPSVSFTPKYKPYGLVGIISPWNVPLGLSLIDAVPALLAGCSVIVKPSEITPRFVDPLMQTIQNIPILADAFAFIRGDGETGAALVDSVDLICFTGSVQTGRKVGEAAARNFIPAFLELGGKDPAIVMEGADLDAAADAVLKGAVAEHGPSVSVHRAGLCR